MNITEEPKDDLRRIQHVTAECRAWQLVECLRDAKDGAPHWRNRAARILQLIDHGILPKPHGCS